jgi:hypothetical protein
MQAESGQLSDRLKFGEEIFLACVAESKKLNPWIQQKSNTQNTTTTTKQSIPQPAIHQTTQQKEQRHKGQYYNNNPICLSLSTLYSIPGGSLLSLPTADI